MSVKVADLFTENVITTVPHKSIGHAREIMLNNKVNSVPVINTEGEPVGIVTPADCSPKLSDNTPVSKVMSENVYTVPKYSDTQIAARVMRNHHIHHLVVTHEKQVVGILSSFDLLKLVEEHRYVPKNPPTKSKSTGKRGKAEV